MSRKIIVVEVKKDEKAIDRFAFDGNELPVDIALPDRAPYDGRSYHISTNGNGGFQFTPDAAEYWVRFGVGGEPAPLIEWMHGESYTLLFSAHLE